MIGLTGPQSAILNIIREHIQRHGYPPTRRELCKLYGVSSTNNISAHLHALQRKGYVVIDPAVGRGIRLSETPGQRPPPRTVRVDYGYVCPCGARHFAASCPFCSGRVTHERGVRV